MPKLPSKLPSIVRKANKRGPLSYSQESLWFLFQLDPSNLAYNLTYLFRLTGGVDRVILERVTNEIARRHENLRTVFPNQAGRPVQVIRPYEPFPLPEIDFSSLPQEERESAISKYALKVGKAPFNLLAEPLTRFALFHASSKEDYLFFATHHIVFDAWSQHILTSELVQLYDDYRSARTPRLPDLPVQFLDYATWQRDWLSGDTLNIFTDHWKNILSGVLPVMDLPTDHPRPVMQTYRGTRHSIILSPSISAQIKLFCKKERITPFHLFLAAYAVLLMRYTGLEDIITGCPFSNRPLPELDGVIGAFINTLPIRLNLSGNPSVRSLLKQVREVMLDAFAWQAAPFDTLVSQISAQRDLSRTPVFQVLINMRNVPRRQSAIDGLNLESVLSEEDTAAFDISLELGEEGNCFNAVMRYNVGLFEKTTISQIVSHFQNILSSMLNGPEYSLADLEMFTPSERQCIVQDWNAASSELTQLSLHEKISAQVAKNPDAPAIICNGRQLTYSVLEKKADQLSVYLLANGCGAGMLVGIFLPRSEDLLVCLLAILKSGCAYVPLDLTYPAERLKNILKDATPTLVITQSVLAAQLPDQYRKVCLDTEDAAIKACQYQSSKASTTGDAIVYVTYTSGSTGRPKGVITGQFGVSNYLNYLVSTFRLQAGERVIQFTPLSFDAACRDTLGVLTFGGTIILMDDKQMRDPDYISGTILEQKITCILSIVPTMLRAVSLSTSKHGTQENCLRLIMSSGEALQVADVELVRNAFGKNVQIVNQYGPTECSMISTMYPVPESFPREIQAIPIGKPINNVRVYILDQNLNPVPVGVKGDLYIGGIAVGHGYLNQPKLTAECFLPDPFYPSGKMYRTGDLARFAKDGTIFYLGRIDQQVKIRGYRVELGEIEAVARECPGIQDAAVVLWPDKPLELLAAYVTLTEGEEERAKDTLSQYLEAHLPFYMLPSAIMVLDKMPLTPNCKINRRALPRPETGTTIDPYIAPRNDVETRLISIWKEVLKVEQVGVGNNFFELGGHSLLAVQLLARVQEEFGQSLPLLLLFKDGTVEAMAKALTNNSKGSLLL